MAEGLSQDVDDILHWLNAHSVQVSDGVPAILLQQKWQTTGRELERLRGGLEWLFQEQLVSLTPGLEPPHVRFTAQGFARLLASFDGNRAAAVAPAPVAAPPPPPRPATTTVPAAAARPLPPPMEQAPPQRFTAPGQPPTEIGLRNQVLHIYRDLKVKAGSQIIAMTLSRYWQEMGLRAGDLRLGIDVLVRDGYLKYSSVRFEPHWMLTEAGYAYSSAALTPAPLLALARPVGQIEDHGLDDAALRRAGLALFRGPPAELRTVASFESAWAHDDNSLLHALDLLWKAELIELHLGATLAIRLTERGIAARVKTGGLRRLIGL
ncbi:MAG: hypothetical protein Q8Q73_04315 [Stagnimonas sp.]|nr:hypothetical protein [Stagnimonas sp.]